MSLALWRAMREDQFASSLNPTARLVLLAIDQINREEPVSDGASAADVQKYTGLSASTTTLQLGRLTQWGWLQRSGDVHPRYRVRTSKVLPYGSR